MYDLYQNCEAFHPDIECAVQAFMSNHIWTMKIPIRGVTPIIHLLLKASFLSNMEFYRLLSVSTHAGVVPRFQSYNNTFIYVSLPCQPVSNLCPIRGSRSLASLGPTFLPSRDITGSFAFGV